MELKEYMQIFKENYKVFLITLGLVCLVGSVGQLLWADKYKVELDLNVTRTGYQKETNEYRYDEFYRLQADERFADTVVRWLGSEVIKNEINKKIGTAQFEKLKAERLSSQMIRVSFVVANKEWSQSVASAIDTVINTKISELNLEQKNPQWFRVLVSYPIASQAGIGLTNLILAWLSGGIFLGVWAVLIRHYLKD